MSAAPPPAGAAQTGRLKDHETIVKRARGKEHDDDHSGTWKVAFADFCLALMCLFLVLWLLNAKQQEASLAHGEHSLLDGGSGILEADRSHIDDMHAPTSVERHFYDGKDDLSKLATRLRKASEQAGLQDNLGFEVSDAGLRVLLHDTDRRGVFQLGSAIPEARFRDLIRQLGRLFAGVGNPILVVGHTDARPYRSANGQGHSNWRLSSERALAARDLMIDGGMPSLSVLQTAGMADNAPLFPDDPNAAANRRIEFIVLSAQRAATMRQMYGAPQHATQLIDGADAVGQLPGFGPPHAEAAVPN
ncbi:OmpA family protein [Xanthomonas campestris pv. phormiicola]|nr:OmpA family protein [Xanthomonas campestris pv. phormiicola]UYC17865.1 OmpA family protein [Xanthomonas campestris pv. phormiicola]